MPFTEASESMSLPMLEPSLAMEGMVIWKLWVAIWPTTVVTPLEQEVLGQRLKEEVAQLSEVSPFEVKTPMILLTQPLSFLMASASVSALTLMEACRSALSGVAWMVAEPWTLMVLESQQLEVGEGQQLSWLRMLGRLDTICACRILKRARQKISCLAAISIIENCKMENEFILKQAILFDQLAIYQSTSTLALTCTCPYGTLRV